MLSIMKSRILAGLRSIVSFVKRRIAPSSGSTPDKCCTGPRIVKKTISADAGRITFAVAMKNGDVFRSEFVGLGYPDFRAHILYQKFLDKLEIPNAFLSLRNQSNGTEVAVRASDIDKVVNVERYENIQTYEDTILVYDDVK